MGDTIRMKNKINIYLLTLGMLCLPAVVQAQVSDRMQNRFNNAVNQGQRGIDGLLSEIVSMPDGPSKDWQMRQFGEAYQKAQEDLALPGQEAKEDREEGYMLHGGSPKGFGCGHETKGREARLVRRISRRSGPTDASPLGDRVWAERPGRICSFRARTEATKMAARPEPDAP